MCTQSAHVFYTGAMEVAKWHLHDLGTWLFPQAREADRADRAERAP